MTLAAATSRQPTESTILEVSGMNCASCVAHVEKAASIPGVESVRVNLATGRAAVRYSPAHVSVEGIAQAISDAGYPTAAPNAASDAGGAEERRALRQAHEAAGWAWRAAAGVALWLPVEALHWISQWTGREHHAMAAQSMWMGWLAFGSSTAAMVLVGSRFYVSAWKALRHHTTNMDTLISIGASVAYFYSLAYFVGGLGRIWPAPASHELYFMEASGLLALISLGHWLEARARQSAGSAIRELLQLVPAVALRMKPDAIDANKAPSRVKLLSLPLATSQSSPQSIASIEYEEIPASRLQVNDKVLVRPGDRIPTDGDVIEGRSTVDESMITGEAIPVTRVPGDAVIGGTVNQEGRLVFRVTRTGDQTALAQIVALVENAQSTKPPIQQLADKVSAVFVPVVLVIALLTGVCWYIGGHHAGWTPGHTWSALAKAVCSVLIIACPCALGLAVPATVMVGTGLGARRGILIRDIDALQNAERINTVVLDKTGTITKGKPTVSKVVAHAGSTDEELLRFAAAAEQYSGHPLAKAIVAIAKSRGISIPQPAGFSNDAGFGVVAELEWQTILVGNGDLLAKHGGDAVDTHLEAESADGANSGATRIFVARKLPGDSSIQQLGFILIEDELKPDSIKAIGLLHEMGLRTVLLTGDNQAAAIRVAREVGIDDVRAQVKPDQKAAVIAALQQTSPRSSVAMVGDGINDAPALATANLGIAIGGGSDIAKEAGDIVLVSGSLLGVAASIRLSRATMRKIRQNLFLAFIYNVLAIPIAAGVLYPAFGITLSPIIAAAAMALSDVTVIGNALLLRRVKID